MPQNQPHDITKVTDPVVRSDIEEYTGPRTRAAGRRAAATPTRTPRIAPKFVWAMAAAVVVFLGGGALLASTLNHNAPVVDDALTTPQFSSDPFSGASDARRVLDERTRLGAVGILTANLSQMSEFYSRGIGLDILSENTNTVSLGSGGQELVRLTAADLPATAATEAGLFYTAIRLPDAGSLAATLSTMTELAPASYQSSFDRGVSQDFYFADPDGNGVALTIDRPSDQWQWKNGRVQWTSEPLDPATFIADTAAAGAVAATGPATIGHVALRVGNLALARAFYVDTLGFDVTVDTGDGTVSMGAGGYHHFLTVSSVTSPGVGVRAATLGLDEFTVVLGDTAALDAAASRFEQAGLSVDRTGSTNGSFTVNDPWANTVLFRIA